MTTIGQWVDVETEELSFRTGGENSEAEVELTGEKCFNFRETCILWATGVVKKNPQKRIVGWGRKIGDSDGMVLLTPEFATGTIGLSSENGVINGFFLTEGQELLVEWGAVAGFSSSITVHEVGGMEHLSGAGTKADGGVFLLRGKGVILMRENGKEGLDLQDGQVYQFPARKLSYIEKGVLERGRNDRVFGGITLAVAGPGVAHFK